MRLIDADALMRKLTHSPNNVRYREFDCDNFPSTLTLGDAKKLVRGEPTVSPWIKTSDRLPTQEDADEDGRVPVLAVGTHTGRLIKMTVHYKVVPANVDLIKYFLPIPPLPDV